jgi:hypothetical protein
LLPQSVDLEAVLPGIRPAGEERPPPALRGRVFPDLGVRGIGIPAAVVVQAGRAAAIRLTADVV